MDKNFASFIKFGKKEYMERLYFEGEIFCKELSYFLELDEEKLQGDKRDSCSHILQAKNLTFKVKNEIIATAAYGQLYGRDPNKIGNLYCLYGISSDHINFERKANQKLHVDLQSVQFADTAILIFQPLEFINRVMNAIVEEGFECDFAPITYFDEDKYEGKLNQFNKRKKYELQNEVRFWIPNQKQQDLKFNIGGLKDIAAIFPKEKMLELECEPE